MQSAQTVGFNNNISTHKDIGNFFSQTKNTIIFSSFVTAMIVLANPIFYKQNYISPILGTFLVAIVSTFIFDFLTKQKPILNSIARYSILLTFSTLFYFSFREIQSSIADSSIKILSMIVITVLTYLTFIIPNKVFSYLGKFNDFKQVFVWMNTITYFVFAAFIYFTAFTILLNIFILFYK